MHHSQRALPSRTKTKGTCAAMPVDVQRYLKYLERQSNTLVCLFGLCRYLNVHVKFHPSFGCLLKLIAKKATERKEEEKWRERERERLHHWQAVVLFFTISVEGQVKREQMARDVPWLTVFFLLEERKIFDHSGPTSSFSVARNGEHPS